ncbi:unnamed protein product [Paramecium sonneborni]|uniref:BOS complex subunit TMEM147 n=1 Tax=Paramecium sonneborni TaxID=65129 RepID=A0A8S1R9P0_9CILI|nr:unnamed protein product [Paramecium sonneborni]
MAFSHLINCLLLAFGPFFVVYKARSLAEQGAYKTVLISILGCLLTQFCKLFLLASLSVITEQLIHIKLLFDLIDCYGIILVSKQKTNIDDKLSRIFAIAIGWGLMDCVMKHLFTFIPNATTDEFTWTFILRGITANLEFFETLFLVGLLQSKNKISYGLILLKVLVLPNFQDIITRGGLSSIYMFVSRFII